MLQLLNKGDNIFVYLHLKIKKLYSRIQQTNILYENKLCFLPS